VTVEKIFSAMRLKIPSSIEKGSRLQVFEFLVLSGWKLQHTYCSSKNSAPRSILARRAKGFR